MTRRAALIAAALLVGLIDLLPLGLIAKQALSLDAENLSWPPTWWPRHPTLVHFHAAATTVDLAAGARLSFQVALMTVVASLAIAFPAAWLAARRPRVDRVLDLTVLVSRLFPILALAIPIASSFIRIGWYNHPSGYGLWLAHTLLALPFAFYVLRNGLREVPAQLEDAARLDGAGPYEVLRYVTLPLARPSLAAAALLTFVISWDELGYALILQVTDRPLPSLVYYYSAFGYPGMASAIALVMLIPALLLIPFLTSSLKPGALSGSGR